MSIPRNDVLDRLRPKIVKDLASLEHATGLQVRFSRLPATASVMAMYGFDPHTNSVTISLRHDWDDVEVAHELTHMRLELFDGFSVLAWRQNVKQTPVLEKAMQHLRAFSDDEVVHSRLVSSGYRLDGEVLRNQLFDGRCIIVPKQLRSASSLKNDGMAHLDTFGYGDLYRAMMFVQVELIRHNYSDMLSADRRRLIDDFLDTFKRFRPRQHRKARTILKLFHQHDVQTTQGHAKILTELSKIEKVDQFIGVTSYRKENDKFILPFPL